MITKEQVKKVWISKDSIHLLLNDGREATELFNNYQRLKYATPTQRKAYTLSHFGIHWEALDEDLSFDGFFKDKKQPSEIGNIFKQFTSLNVSAIARQINIPQPLMASYISGAKTPGPKRKKEIQQALHALGKQLLAVEL